MEQRVSLITLGVSDLAKAKEFYAALGWRPSEDSPPEIAFFQAAGMIVALWPRTQLAEDSAVSDGGGWGGVTLAHNVRSPAEVDAVIEEARAAGARIGREPAGTFWGRLLRPVHRSRRPSMGSSAQPKLDHPLRRQRHNGPLTEILLSGHIEFLDA
jgi:catechol 2,3-dioxygenase-like lactoylglutathione lyase family enzyme